MKNNYTDFNIGDTYVFTKKYTKKDFETFSDISGDTNPIHFNEEYAKETEFKSIIVPLHLAAAPLSAIAGVIFPGHRSLYLSHDLKAINPIPYDTELTYSAKIIDKNNRDSVLTIRTLIFRDKEIFVEAIQKIKVREDNIPESLIPLHPVESHFKSPENAVLITGALGEIGRRTAMDLGKQGKYLILCAKEIDDRAKDLASKLTLLGANYEFLELDLADINIQKIRDIKINIATIIHAASPPVFSSLYEHMDVSFRSLNTIFNELRYKWLCQQSGRIIFISSSATQFQPQGWENYIAGKSATENYLKGILKTYSNYGIGVNVLSIGLVDTAFSSELGLDSSGALLPEQVADEVTSILEHPKCFYTWLETSYKRMGTFDFIEDTTHLTKVINRGEVLKHETENDLITQLKILFKDFFNFSEIVDWNNLGINLTPSWDSLRHIELLMTIESTFTIKITTEEIDKTRSFLEIYSLLKTKVI
ncbi:MAG: NAD(P)-dependent dehydrogenase (short-subunit alcohol dehydrogenase family)/acyl dehydratase [Psychroserpens sp.]|jgi:3-oxoacyl-[acyl-carrier protein] reductase